MPMELPDNVVSTWYINCCDPDPCDDVIAVEFTLVEAPGFVTLDPCGPRELTGPHWPENCYRITITARPTADDIGTYPVILRIGNAAWTHEIDMQATVYNARTWAADINKDGVVNSTDYLWLANVYGETWK